MSNKNTKQRTTAQKWTRRAFIGVGGLAGVGLISGVGFYTYAGGAIKKYSGSGLGDGKSMNAWVRIAPDNSITLSFARAEMGQGVDTALSQLIAEELEVPMESITVVQPQPESPYSNTFMVTQKQPNIFKSTDFQERFYSFIPVIGTGGSTTISDGWNNMRYAGATAREMLKQAAAKRWKVEASSLKAENGHIINGSQKFSYGELAEEAATIKLDGLPELKKKSDYKVIGKPVKRIDLANKVNGTATFGLDVRLDGMLYGAVRFPTAIGGTIKGFTNKDKVMGMPGVKNVILTKYNAAVVVATNTWQAIQGSRALRLDEIDNGNGNLSSEQIIKDFTALLDEKPIATPRKDGDVDQAFAAKGGKVVEALYHVPYLAHAAMEPINCTALVKDGKAACWVGHQAVSVAHTMMNESTGIDKANIEMNIQYLGGGFGRRSEPDFIRIAGATAKEMEGTPVQILYSREEDMKNDMYRPLSVSRFKAKISDSGEVEAWDNMMALQSVSNNAILRIMPMMAPEPAKDEQTAEGASNLEYDFKNMRVAFGHKELPIPIGFWRSVGNSQNAFFAESFMDEVAHAAGKDPMAFRKTYLKGNKRFIACLDKVAEMSGWSKPLPANHFRGVAICKSFGSIVAEVAVVEKIGEKNFKIKDFYCAIDCGSYVNPSIIESQVQGGVIYGLSAALHGQITIANGAAVEVNFPQYPSVTLKDCPNIHVAVMEVEDYPSGVGEPGLPPAAPALANALFAATGERVRSLPLTKLGYTFG
jgi:isoquinoline 1-oxidoreductase subunit beta